MISSLAIFFWLVMLRGGFEIYSHLTCPTSYRLFKRLAERGVLGRVFLRDVGLDLFRGYSRGVISVPAIFHGDILIYSGYFDIDEAGEVIATGSLPRLGDFDYGEASIQAMEGILDSYATALWLYLTDSIESILYLRPFIEAVSRHIFYTGRSDESYERLAREVRELYRGEKGIYLERLREIVAKNIAREIIWLGRDPKIYKERIDREYLEHILLARVAIGRIGLFMGYNVKTYKERIEELYKYIEKTWEDISGKVEKEISRILGDHQYIQLYTQLTQNPSE